LHPGTGAGTGAGTGTGTGAGAGAGIVTEQKPEQNLYGTLPRVPPDVRSSTVLYSLSEVWKRCGG